MTLRALFRVDGGAGIGVGHFSRSLTLARRLAAGGVDIVVATTGIPAAVAPWVPASARIRTVQAEEPMRAIVESEAAEIIVVDGYHLPSSAVSDSRGDGRIVVAIEDHADARLDADVLVDANLIPASRGPRAGRIDLFGPRFAMIRDDIRQARLRSAPNGAIRRALVTLGGADPQRLTPAVARAVAAALPTVAVRVMAPPTNPQREELAVVAQRHANVRVQTDASMLAAELGEADLVVCSAGTTVLEVCCVGAAMMLLPFVDNQRPVAAAAAELGIARVVDASPPFAAELLAKQLAALDAGHDDVAAMVRRQRALVDGCGADRIADELLAMVDKERRRSTC